MKKSRMALLLLVYAVLFIFTLYMEWEGIRDPSVRAAANLSTLAMALLGGAFCALLYRRERADKEKRCESQPEGMDAADSRAGRGNGAAAEASCGDWAEGADAADAPEICRSQDNGGCSDGGACNGAGEQEWIVDKEAYLAFAHEKELTRRETEIAYLAVSGYSNQRLAEELYISEATVKKHMTHIYEKTGANGRKALKETVKNLQDPR